MINKRTTFCHNRWQRQAALDRARAALRRADDYLILAIFFIVFLYPFLLDPTLIFTFSAWLWWVKGFAWIGLLAWAGTRLLVGVPLAQTQVTGASVEAMAQATPETELVPFTAVPVEHECTLLPWRQPPLLIKQQTRTQLRQQWRRQQRAGRTPLLHSPAQRFIPLPSRRQKPSA